MLGGSIDRVPLARFIQNSAIVKCRRKHIFISFVHYSLMLFQCCFPGSNQGVSINPATDKVENLLKKNEK